MKRFFCQVLCPLGGGLLLLFPGWFIHLGWKDNIEAWAMSVFLLGLFPLLYNRRIFSSAEDFDSWREKKEGTALIWRVFSIIGFALPLFLLTDVLVLWRLERLYELEFIGLYCTAGYIAALFLLLLLSFFLTPLFRKRRKKKDARPEKTRRFDLSRRWALGVIVFGWTVFFHLLCVITLLSVCWFENVNFWLNGIMVFVFSLYYMGYTWFLSYYRPRPCVRLFFLLANLWSCIFFYVVFFHTPLCEWLFPESEWAIFGVIVYILIPLWMSGGGAIVSETVGYYRDIERNQREKNESEEQGESLDAPLDSSGREEQE